MATGWKLGDFARKTLGAQNFRQIYDAERTDALWYAPQVGRWVRREWTGSFMPGSPTPRAGMSRRPWRSSG